MKSAIFRVQEIGVRYPDAIHHRVAKVNRLVWQFVVQSLVHPLLPQENVDTKVLQIAGTTQSSRVKPSLF